MAKAKRKLASITPLGGNLYIATYVPHNVVDAIVGVPVRHIKAKGLKQAMKRARALG